MSTTTAEEKEEILWLISEELAGRKVYPLKTAEDHRERARGLRASGSATLAARGHHYDKAAEAMERLPDADPEVPARPKMPRFEAAQAFLREALAAGPCDVDTLRRKATAVGHAWRTVERAKAALRIEAERSRGEWCWWLPPRDWPFRRHRGRRLWGRFVRRF